MTAFQEALREALEESRAEQRTAFGADALLWLAVVPEWTEQLAARCGFPAEDIPGWVRRADEAGLCEAHAAVALDGGAQLTFRMPATARDSVLEDAGPTHAARTASSLGSRIAELADELDVAPSIRRWAELASGNPYTIGDELSRRANPAIARNNAAEALDWITAGESLAPVFGGELPSAVARAKRRLNLVYRSHQDERLLAGFVRREEPITAVERLLDGPDAEWALHLIGMGGAGKTMVVRYIASLFVAERRQGRRLPLARVDFDYIPASFPFDKPAELLVRLCDGLAQHVEDEDQEARLEDFVAAKRDADEALAGLAGDPQQRIKEKPIQAVLDAFAAFVASLGPRTLLILDTCEELAKLYPGEGSVPSVDAMWLLMQETHDRVPGVRVLLAGRRLLASADADGPYDAERQPGSIASFEERPYLRTFEVRGFRRDEAVALLERAGAGDHTLVETILDNARELGRTPGVRGGAEGPDRDRYNPFDLNLYATWLRANPRLTAQNVGRREADSYIQARIVERLKDAGVDAALAGVAVLRRFDLAMLAPCLPGDVDPERVFAVLSEQEWVDLSGGHTADTLIVAVEPHLVPRLERYCRSRRAEEWQAARERALEAAEELLEHAPLEELGVERAEVALRLAEPERGAAIWERLERRIMREGAWNWAVGACDRLRADEEDVETGANRPRFVPLRAHLLATQLAALRHRSPAPAPVDADGWRQVAAWAGDHPSELIAAWLKARAGVLTESLDWAVSYDFDDWQREQFEGACVTALELRLDSAAPRPREELPAAAYLRAAPASARHHPGTLLVRARLVRDDAIFEMAEARAVDGPPAPRLDWVPHASMRDRVRLEWLLAATDACTPPPAYDGWLVELADGAEPLTVDGERLASLAVLRSLADGTDPHVAVNALLDRAVDEPYGAACLAHRRVPPLFAAVARADLKEGAAGRALELLIDRRRRYERARGADPVRAEAARTARREIVGVLRRMRLPDVQLLSGTASGVGVTADELGDVAAAEVLAVSASPRYAVELRDPRARWRIAVTPPRAELEELTAVLENELASADRRLDIEHLTLDLDEAQLLEDGTRRDYVDFDQRWRALRDEERVSQTEQEALDAGWARLALRGGALSSREDDIPAEVLELPPRRLAEIALEEGELLALRLPKRARRLLGAARVWYHAADDDVGELIAATAEAGAHLRDQDFTGARRALAEHVRGPYERVARDAALPDWEPLSRWDPESAGDWRGWLRRLYAYRMWAAGTLESFGEAPELTAPGVEPAAAPAERPATVGRLAAATGFAALAGCMALLVLAVLRGGVFPWVGAAVLGVAAYALLAARFAPQMLVAASSAWRVRAVVERGRDAPERFHVHVTLLPRTGRFPRLGSAEQDMSFDGPAAREEGPVHEFFVSGPGRRPPLPAVDLVVPPEAAREPWEARLLAHTVGQWRGHAPDVARESASRGRLGEWRTPRDTVAIVAPRRWALLVERAWGDRAPLHSGQPSERPFADPPRAAVLVGAAVETSGGPRLRLDAERLAQVSDSTVTAASEEDEELLDPREVVRLYAQTVIVVGLPGPLDPASSAALRGFAADVSAGGRAVIALPTLPPDVAGEALAAVAKGWPLTGERARQAARAARDVIYERLSAGAGSPKAATEAALDVCVFLAKGR